MAGEVAHVVYGARLLTYLKEAVKDPAYWAGTLFPDIRHLGVVSRRRTHLSDVTLRTVVGNSDFYTGMRVHAWIDATREKFLGEANVKELLPWHPFVPHALKLFEDELLYERYDDWNLIQRALQRVYDEERLLIAEERFITTWHTILFDYFREAPSDTSRRALSLAIGLSENSAAEVNSICRTLKRHAHAQPLLEQWWHHLEQLLE